MYCAGDDKARIFFFEYLCTGCLVRPHEANKHVFQLPRTFPHRMPVRIFAAQRTNRFRFSLGFSALMKNSCKFGLLYCFGCLKNPNTI
jgi:hypothetical protein